MLNPGLDEGWDLKIVGIGGAGSNIVSYMLSREIPGAQFIVMNTDAASLEANPCQNKVLMGHGNLEKGPLLGRQSVLKSQDCVVDGIFDARLVIFIAGMGGNTDTSALPLLAEMAKEMDIFVVCMVTMPLAFEDKRRRERAQEGVESLKKIADNVVVFQNNDFLKGLSSNTSIADAFEKAKDALFQGAHYISGLLDSDTSDMDEEDFQYIVFVK